MEATTVAAAVAAAMAVYALDFDDRIWQLRLR
jgi:hypothetical protein